MKNSKFKYVIKEEEKELRIKELLRRHYGFSSRLIRKLKVQGGVCLNGQPARLYDKGKAGDVVTCDLPQETSHFEPEPIPISVAYEDDDLLLINKQPGYVVHPTKGHANHTIANGLMQYMLDSGKEYKIRFINRLDMDTSGLLIIAKNSHCQDDFSRQAEKNQVVKKYLAIVEGIVEEDEGTIDLPIGQEDPSKVKRTVLAEGYPSVTHYRTVERIEPAAKAAACGLAGEAFPGYTLLELKLDTGRTHQIRVHLAHIGHPIVGDSLYGSGALDGSRTFACSDSDRESAASVDIDSGSAASAAGSAVNVRSPEQAGGNKAKYSYEMRELSASETIDKPIRDAGEPVLETAAKESGSVIGRQALHAWYLSFIHPVTRKRMEVKTELPADMKLELERLRDLCKSRN